MKEQVRDYAIDMDRPFTVRYNALTQSIEVLDTKDILVRFANGIRGDMGRLVSALEKGHIQQ
jgi:phenylalanine-4-hydroxylase